MKTTNLFHHKAVILAGGAGTRLYPITKEIPKPLLLIKRKPIINYLVDLFFSQGIKDITILINKDFRADFDWWKKRYYGSTSSPQVPKIKIIEEEKPLGTLGGLWHLKRWISNTHFFFTNGDELKKIDLVEMNKFHKKMDVPATIALVKVPDPHHYGVVICKRGLVQEFLEKPQRPPSKYINSGIYLFSPEIFKYHPGSKFSMVETDLFPQLAEEQKLAGFKFDGRWMDCGTWDRYSTAIEKWR